MVRFVARCAVVALAWLFVGRSLCAADLPVADRIVAHLAVGEFAPAVELAKSVKDGPQRDALFVKIADAQQQQGVWNAALYSASEIDDDALRVATYTRLKSQPLTAQGGGTQADFDPLIELITSTVKPMTWEPAGGAGNVKGFESGVFVDAAGVLKRQTQPFATDDLADLRAMSRPTTTGSQLRRATPLRKISLTQLERQVQRRLIAGEPLPEEMLVLAGLQRIQYVLLYPETGDIVLAGPAGDWRRDAEGRLVSADNGHPVLQLHDLVTIFRHGLTQQDQTFGCSIDPTNDGLQKAQAYIGETTKSPLKQGQAGPWLKQIADRLGQQKVTIFGVDSHTRVGQVLVEADYRMKRTGLGLEEGVLNCPSFLDTIQVEKGKSLPAMSMVRWWFTMNYDSIRATKDRDAFAFRGQGVQLQSENEFLNAQGQREHTGDADTFNRLYAQNFTKHFVALAKKYPVYADLQNLFDLALVAAVLKTEDVPNKFHWQARCFLDPKQYVVPTAAAPQKVDTVVNHRIINNVHVVGAVSGGVRVEPQEVVKQISVEQENRGAVWAARYSGIRGPRPKEVWWWD